MMAHHFFKILCHQSVLLESVSTHFAHPPLRPSVSLAKCRYTIRKMQHIFIADSLYAVSYTSGPSLYLVLQDVFQAPSRDRSLTVTTSPAGCIYSGCLVFRSIGYRRSNFFKVTIVPMAMKTHKLYYYDKRQPHTK